MQNLGNTCYLNALFQVNYLVSSTVFLTNPLQSLVSCESLIAFLEQNLALLRSASKDEKISIMISFCKLLLDLHRGRLETDPSHFYDMLCSNFTELFQQEVGQCFLFFDSCD